MTGALYRNLPDVLLAHLDIREELGDDETLVEDFETAQNVAVMFMWKYYVLMETFNTGRRALGDWDEDPSKDFLMPLLHAMAANEENIIRQHAGLPSAMPEDELGLLGPVYW